MKKSFANILIMIVVALMLDVLPLPAGVVWFRPHWTFLIIAYWFIENPYYLGIFTVFIVGIILDILNGSLIGMHAFALITAAFLFHKFHNQARTYPPIQQMIFIFLTAFLYQLLIFIILTATGEMPQTSLFWLPVLTTTILWPWLFTIEWLTRVSDV